MDELIVVTYPQPLPIEARPVDHESVPDGAIGLAYFFRGHMIARGVMSREAVGAINRLLENPVPVALAASEDDEGNIEGRVCLVLPMKGGMGGPEEEEEPEEPWKASVPPPPWESGGGGTEDEEGEEDKGQVALLPIGNVVRSARDRHHPDVVGDAREMLENLLSGQAKDAVSKAIDDLLDSL